MDTAEAIKELAQVPERASASHCFGTAVSAGEHTVIPVAEVGYGVGFGWGSGGGTDHGSGVRVHPVYDQTAIALAGDHLRLSRDGDRLEDHSQADPRIAGRAHADAPDCRMRYDPPLRRPPGP